MRQKPTDGYADRLRWALEQGPRATSVRGLHVAMIKRFPGERGTSYGGIRQYVEGGVRNPRVELLRGIAEVLAVRPEWLTFDEGHPTEARATAAGVADAAMEEWRDRAGASVGSMYGALGVPEWAGRDGRRIPYWVAPLAELEILRGLDVGRVAGALAGFLVALGEDAADMEEAGVSDYIMSMIPVVQGLAHRRSAREVGAHFKRERDEAIRRSVAANTRTIQTQEDPDV